MAVQRRDPMPGAYTTVPAHMPKAHQKHLVDRPHPEQGYRSCLGILRLAKQYGNERLEAASKRALAVNARSYRHLQSILKHGLDRFSLVEDDEPQRALPMHENVRGRDYYH